MLWLSRRQNIESRLKVLLPDDVGAALMDGVVLCHLANNISPRSVASIHVPSPAVVSVQGSSSLPYLFETSHHFGILPSSQSLAWLNVAGMWRTSWTPVRR